MNDILQTQEQVTDPQIYNRLFDFSAAKIVINTLLGQWSEIETRTKKERINRMIDLDPEVLEKNGQLASDETIINWRLIDTNIKREQPSYVAFLTQSRRLITLEPANPLVGPVNVAQLEEQFSKGMKYEGWQVPHIMTIDGHQCHGWDAVEVVLDLEKPFHLRIDHIGQENLIFPLGAQSLDSCEHILIKMTVSQMELRSFVQDYGFDAKQVERILSTKQNSPDDTINIYKRFYKYQGIVYVCWFEDTLTDGWLKAPEMFVSGLKRQETIIVQKEQMVNKEIVGPNAEFMNIVEVQTVPVEKQIVVDAESTSYPVFLLRYGVTEEKPLVNSRGRAFIDNSKQEASCGLWSAMVNSAYRGSCVYGSVAGQNMDGSNRPSMLEGLSLEPNRIYDRKIDMFSPPGPSAVTLSAAEKIDNKNSAEAGQIEYATMNREDSRKTKQELMMSQQKGAELSSVNVTMLSLWIQQVYGYCFRIVQTRAINSLLPLLVVKVEQTPEGPLYINDVETLGQEYIVKAAGDTDYIGRREKLAAMKANWPVIQTTPLAMVYLMDMLTIEHPEDAARYAQILKQGDQKKQLIQEMGSIIANVAKQEGTQMAPEEQQMLIGLQQRVQQVLTQP